MNITTRGDGSQQAESCRRDSKDQRSIAAPLTKTETASEGGLDPTVESIGVVCKPYHARQDHKRAVIGGTSGSRRQVYS